jgi:DNA-binding MarR family transcriptional regulator
MEQNRDFAIREIFENINSIQQMMFKQKNYSPADFGIPPAQGIVLHTIANRGSLDITDIAEVMQVSRSAVTQFVDSLVKSGFVTREANPSDRRAMISSLPEEGQSKLQEFQQFHIKNMSKVFNPLNDQELKIFRDLLLKIIVNNSTFKE